MKKTELKNLSKEYLQKKKDSLKIFTGIFIPLILFLSYFGIRGYFNGEEIDWISLTMAICSIGGFLPVYQELKQVQEELRTRS